MIKVEEHRIFSSYLKKLTAKQLKVYKARILQFQNDPRSALLRVHPLKGALKGRYSFSLGGNLRVVFFWPTKDRIILYKIGSHNQVY